MTQARTKRKPVRFGRKARRAFYKTVHAVLPRKIRQPLRNAIKGRPPTPEELAAQRQAEEAERQALREAQERTRAGHGAERERETWVKDEAGALKREAAKEERAKVDAERRAQKEAQERDRASLVAEKERRARAKADSARRAEGSKDEKKPKALKPEKAPKQAGSAPSGEIPAHAEQEES